MKRRSQPRRSQPRPSILTGLKRRGPWRPGIVAMGALVGLLALVGGCDEDAGQGAGSVAPGPGGGPGEGPGGREVPPFEPAPAVMARLTAAQHRNALEDIFGPDLPRTEVEQDTNPHLFFSIGATTTTLTERGVEQYGDAALKVAEVVFSDPARREALIGCALAAPDDDCARGFLARIGRSIMRRPLTDEELGRWLGLSRAVVEGEPGAEPALGLRVAVAGMMQSPHFLYRVEIGEPIVGADPSRRRYTAWEMAQRLSFLVWNSTPDEALLDAAARGELLDEGSVRQHALRMLDAPRARVSAQSFFAQYLDLSRLDGVDRDPALYPGYSPTLPAAMRTELQLLVDDVVFRRNGDMRELFFAPRGFVNDELAALYEVDAPGASPVSFVPVEFPDDSPRAGILTLGAFLAMNAHPTETSPTLRGKYIRERVLCQTVPAPPDDVDLNLDDMGAEPQTLRERLERHRLDPACRDCHAFIDPPGFLFEHFDSIGRFRTQADGFDLDTSGDLDGVGLADARDLAALLAGDPRLPACVVRQLYRHANGRLEAPSEEAAIVDLQAAFEAQGFRFRDLLLALATSEGFRTVSAQEAAP